VDAGKLALKWGKGYAWNPVGFVERAKDPNDPELAREGYTMLSADYIRNFDGPLQTLAFTPVLLPVSSGANNEPAICWGYAICPNVRPPMSWSITATARATVRCRTANSTSSWTTAWPSMSPPASAPCSSAGNLAQGPYGRPNAGREYLYLRMSQKEPFDILYFTPP